MGEIIYQGKAPFHMPTAQPPFVRGNSGNVELIVFASVQGKGPNEAPVRFDMSADQARMLIAALVRAVREAEDNPHTYSPICLPVCDNHSS